MIFFLKIPRDAAERMYLLGPGQYHRNWWPESNIYLERHFIKHMKGRMTRVKAILEKESRQAGTNNLIT